MEPMSIYLEKLLPVFVFPLGLAVTLCLLALGLSMARRHFASRVTLAIAILGLWVASMPAFAGLIMAKLEDQNPPIAVAAAPAVDVIIVLGGGIAAPRAELTEAELSRAHDRLGQAYDLWRAGKGKLILISGGNLPWLPLPRPEAELAEQVLEQLGVPRDVILVEGQSRNTRENAVNTAVLWRERGFRSGLLVTSAMHMPRALATFRAVGLDLVPWPTDVRRPMASSVFDLLPDAGALAATTASAKEWLGLVAYRWLGWAQ